MSYTIFLVTSVPIFGQGFKLVQLVKEAWTVLSDKTKRLLYDQKRKVVVLQQKTAQSNRTSSTQGATNGFKNFAAKSPAFKQRANKPKNGRREEVQAVAQSYKKASRCVNEERFEGEAKSDKK